MEYFYDHETDTLSVTLGDFGSYHSSDEVAPGVIVHSDTNRRALAVEIRGARLVIGVQGLSSFETSTISADDFSSRMSNSLHGRAVLRALQSV